MRQSQALPDQTPQEACDSTDGQQCPAESDKHLDKCVDSDNESNANSEDEHIDCESP